MSNNLALFITHHVFLTDDEVSAVTSGGSVSCLGHCVPVWVDAKTGRTTEPAKEVFCSYEVSVGEGGPGTVETSGRTGYGVRLPVASGWSPPEEIDFEAMSSWTEEARSEFLANRQAWWFNNPRPADASDLKNGYLRFDFKEHDLKVGRRKYSLQHVVEVASLRRLNDSLTG